ncbi:hypothetical protein [Micromonospora sp. NPDC049679]|uniref:hypothetical protein n=1 Tax=Micromonospora sp. NPDC049679 TaxID=3155920 RepID=UPI0033CE2636
MGEATAGGAVRTGEREVGEAATEIFRRPQLEAVPAWPEPPAADHDSQPTFAPVSAPVRTLVPNRRPELVLAPPPVTTPEPASAPEPAHVPELAPVADPDDAVVAEQAFDIDLPLDVEPELDPPYDEAPLSPSTTRTGPQEPSWNRPSGVSPITRAERRAAEAAAAARATGVEQAGSAPGQLLWALTRVMFGLAFLWTFFDKLFGLDAPTPAVGAWRTGTSPTSGFLAAVDGPFVDVFGKLVGRAWVDWAFMIALAVIGLGLLLGVGMIIAATTGTVLLVLTWMAALPLAGNPVFDERLLAALVLICITVSGAGLRYSLAPWWRRSAVVRTLPVLR